MLTRGLNYQSEPDCDSDQAFAKEVQETLGYTIPTADRPPTWLSALDPQPFTQESVDAYKAEVVAKANQTGKALAARFLIAAVVCSIGLAILILQWWHLDPPWWACIGDILCGSGAILCVIIGLGGLLMDYHWQSYTLRKYSGPVPEFALETALNVKRLSVEYHSRSLDGLPNVEFYIEQLEETTDPFMVAYIAGRPYYLEVWNEPGFKQQRTI